MPLKGKIINVSKQSDDKIFKNDEIQTMITAFGCGIGDSYDETKLRYDKIIFMTDADVDGAHIDCLGLTFILTVMPQLIEDGHVYLCQTPLYQIFVKDTRKEFYEYVYTDKELIVMKKKYGNKIKRISRFKGLGEMNPEQLAEVALNKKTRKLKRVVINNQLQSKKTMDLLMGNNSELRRNWIMDYAKKMGDEL